MDLDIFLSGCNIIYVLFFYHRRIINLLIFQKDKEKYHSNGLNKTTALFNIGFRYFKLKLKWYTNEEIDIIFKIYV